MPTPCPKPRPWMTHCAAAVLDAPAIAPSAAHASAATASPFARFGSICLVPAGAKGVPNRASTARPTSLPDDRRTCRRVPWKPSHQRRFHMAIATQEQTVVDKVAKQLYIGGEWRDASGGETLAVEDPATGEALCEIADGTPEDAKAALDAAVGMQAEWAATSPNERSEILWRAFELLNERADELALLMTLEMGKTVAESKGEIAYSAEFFRWFSGEALRIDGYYKTAGNGQSRVLVMRQPVGPCFFITPWNFPNAMGTRKIGPAIAAGCTMVVKPAHQTPLSMLALAKVLEECGLPPGVLHVVTSRSSAEVSAPIISDPRLRKLSFTGSTEVGRKLIAQAADQVLKVSMELGGNAPFVVFEDADLDAAVDGAMLAKMRNVGEACTSANRFHVHESVAEEFGRRLAERMGALKVGRGTDEGIDV